MGQKTVAEIGDEGQLADYYLAALDYIDPALTPDSSLDDVQVAAARRRDVLARGSRTEIHEELGALSEALQFIQRVHRTRTKPDANPVTPADSSAVAGSETGLKQPTDQNAESIAGTSIAEAASDEKIRDPDSHGQGLLDFDIHATLAIATESKPATSPANAAAASKPEMTAPLRLPEIDESPAPPAEESPQLDIKPRPATVKRAVRPPGSKTAANSTTSPQRRLSRSQGKRNGQSLREVMAQAQREAAGQPPANSKQEKQQPTAINSRDHPTPRQLPEALAWPIVLGTALIGWQAWLAAYAGWTVTRFFAWPAPDYGYLISGSQAVLLIAVAVIIALVVAKAAWSYRRQTRRLLLLAHLSAALIGMDLTAWWLAALDPDKLIPAPSYWHWVALVIGWLAVSSACWLHDLRVSRHAPE